MKPVVTWIVIADGDQARFYENKGPGQGLTHLKKLDMSQEPLKAQELTSDEAGRTHASSGDGRSAMEPTVDPVAKREDRFTRDLADYLSDRARNDDFDRLILAAAPRALGDLRSHFDKHITEKLTAEIDKDLVNTDEKDLPKHFDDVIAL